MGRSLLNKVWDLHKVGTLPSGQDQLFIGLHLVHEVTSPQAFQALKDRGLTVMYPGRTFATVDHIVPTNDRRRPFADTQAEAMMQAIERNTKEHGIQFFGLGSPEQGIVHIIKQLNKLVDVVHAADNTGKDVIQRELALVKVRCPPEKRTEVIDVVHTFKGQVVDLAETALTVQVTGNTEKVDALHRMLGRYGVIEMVRTGKVIVARGEEVT